jgi:curved DNA-binding protein CbpA
LKQQDYYEFLQISPHAELDTIHRVYKFLAARLHPDNPETGNPEKFFLLKNAYDVLSNPASRSEYDATRDGRDKEEPNASPMSDSLDFMDSLEGELNRRLAVLAVLYAKRRAHSDRPEVTLAEVEGRMGFPRDYMEFTIWYLMKKGYITRSDNSSMTLTADGVDFVESQRSSTPKLNKLLTDGTEPSAGETPSGAYAHHPHQTPTAAHVERRVRGDRRTRG